MLILSRTKGQACVILYGGLEIGRVIMVKERGGKIYIGFDFPSEYVIRRLEVQEIVDGERDPKAVRGPSWKMGRHKSGSVAKAEAPDEGDTFSISDEEMALRVGAAMGGSPLHRLKAQEYVLAHSRG